MKTELVATCLFGLEHLLGKEIDELGYNRISTIDGRVTFLGDEEAIAVCNVNLRYAERVFIKLGDFPAETFDELFEGTKSLPWENWIGQNDQFPVKGHAIQSTLFSVPDCQAICKKAIVNRLSEKYGVRWFCEEGVKYQVEFFIFKNVATLMIDTSGTALHKRGYRPASNAAPIRETLAAAIAATSRPRENVLTWDPMCGSGTIAIEAAMLMRNIAPGVKRHFIAESFPQISRTLWKNAREEALDNEIRDSAFRVYASDIEEKCIALTRENAKRAGVNDCIRSFRADARNIGEDGVRATIVCNPPYGERIGTRTEVEALYREIGAHFRSLAPWQAYIITSCKDFEKFYGKRADKVRKLYNGMIECYLYQYFKNDDKKR